MIRFAHVGYLYLLIVIPLLLGLLWWAVRAQRRALQRFGHMPTLLHLIPEAGTYKRSIKNALLLGGLAFAILALANPQIGTKIEEVKREGVDIIIALDVSNSMKAEDIKPNRLESAKQEISRLLDRLQNDRIGLIVFAGESYVQLPLTTDYAAAKLVLSSIDIDVVPVPGTAIGSALRLAQKAFVEGEKKYRVIVVITDGENHEDDALAAAREAAQDGAVVHAIGMGSPEGAPIPVYQGTVQVGFRKDNDGNAVVTKLDEAGLEQIAEVGGGVYGRATTQEDELDELLSRIQAMEKKEFGAKIFTEFEDRFQYFLALAILCIVGEFFISERKNRLLARWNIFTSRSEQASSS